MANKNDYKNNQNVESPEIIAAKLTLLGSTLSTIGDGLQAIAAGITLQELVNPSKQNSQNNSHQSDQSKQIERLQKQVDQLMRQVQRGNWL
ncbi:translation initiation factor 2 [Rummeliibacillus pycnus]|uniref:translation initiation factor 2 n=1 Tax=Rummeliibacillus pycnus TaxID=101070 RepID=UPI003D27EB53